MQQFVLPFDHDDSYHPENFIVSASNNSAYHALQQWPFSWGYEPYKFSLLVYGPKSSGKTYLAKLWQNISNACLINLDQELEEGTLLSGRAYIIEKAEDWPEEKLLHIFNLLNENHKYLLITTEDSAHNFKIKDLKSRINSLFRLEIYPPDDELIKLLLFKIFSENSIIMSNKVLDFLLSRLPRQFEEIVAHAHKVNQFALTHKRAVTVQLIKEVMNW